MKCYGTKQNKEACPTCDLSEYCKEAHDPPLKTDAGVHFEDVEYSEQYAQAPDVFKLQEDVHKCGDLAGILGELLSRMNSKRNAEKLLELLQNINALAVAHPKTMAIAIEKIAHPEQSYSQIAKKFKCDKQLIHHHLKRAKTLMPDIEHAFLVDGRFKKHRTRLTNQQKRRKLNMIQTAQLGIMREKRGISLRNMAEMTGIPVRSLRDYEAGRTKPPVARLRRIKSVLQNF